MKKQPHSFSSPFFLNKLIIWTMALLLCLWAGMAGSEEKSRIDSQQIKSHQQALPQTANSKTVVNKYVLAMSKNDDICGHMLKIFNEDLQKYGDIKFNQHDEFTAIKWEKKRRYRINEKGEKDYDDKGIRGTDLFSIFDINNDMAREVVVKSYDNGLRGIPSDRINVFPEDDAESFKDGIEASEKTYSKIMAGFGIIGRAPFSNNTYSLKEIPPITIVPKLGTERNVRLYHFLGGWFYFNPFFYKGIYYVTMTDWQPHRTEKWLVILKLNPENQLQDICYYQRNLVDDYKTRRRR